MSSSREMAAKLHELDRRLRALETTPQLGFSSIEDAAMNTYDAEGGLKLVTGKQFDGTWVAAPVSGPVPPTPSEPRVVSSIGGLEVSWDGGWAVPVNPLTGWPTVAPMDFARVEVHVSETPDFEPSFSGTLRGTIESPSGAGVVISPLPQRVQYVRLVARSFTGKASLPSGQSSALPAVGVENEMGELTASIDPEGRGSFSEMSADEIFYRGKVLRELLDEKAEGIVTLAFNFSDTLRADTYSKVGYVETAFTVEPNRQYKVSATGLMYGEPGSSNRVTLRYTTDDSPPTVNSPIMTQWQDQWTSEGVVTKSWSTFRDHTWFASVNSGQSYTLRILIVCEALAAGKLARIPASDDAPLLLLVEDMGVLKSPNIQYNDGGGQTGGGSTPAPGAPPAPRVQRVGEWGAAWTRTWKGNGALRTDTTDIVQGYNGTNGNGGGAFAWPDLTGVLAGATIDRVEIFMHANHWYYNSGGIAVLGWHGSLGVPGGRPGGAGIFHVGGWPKPGSRWVDVTGWGAGIQSGQIRGVCVGPAPNNDLRFYGRFSGLLEHCRIRVVYTK